MTTSSWTFSIFNTCQQAKGNHLLYGKQITLYYPALKRYLIVMDTNLAEKDRLNDGDDGVTTDKQELLKEAHYIQASTDDTRDMMVTLTSVLPKKDSNDVHTKCIWLIESDRRMDNPHAPTDGSMGGAVHYGGTVTEEGISRGHWVRLQHFNSGKYLGLDKSGEPRLIPVNRREDAVRISLEPTTSQLNNDLIHLSDFIYLVAVEGDRPSDKYNQNGRSWLCAGSKSLGDMLTPEDLRKKSQLTLEQCQSRCGNFWTNAVRENVQEIVSREKDNKLSQDWFLWLARKYTFQAMLKTSFDATADAYPLNRFKGQVDSGAFQVRAVDKEIASEIHECLQAIRHLGRLRTHLHNCTTPSAQHAVKDLDASGLSTEQTQGVLMQQVVVAAAGLVFYVIRASEEQRAEYLHARDFKDRMQKLMKLDFEKAGGLPRRQRFVREHGGFELLFDLIAWAALGQAAIIAGKLHNKGKTKGATELLDGEIKTAKTFGLSDACLPMKDAQRVRKFILENPKPDKNTLKNRPRIDRPYGEVGQVFYSFMRQLFKGNRSVERMVSSYLHVILGHFPINIGAPATFACLTDDNRDLLENRVQNKHIKRFLSMIKYRGLRPAFMEYLYSLCGYLDMAVSSKQVSVCRLAFGCDEESPGSIIIQTLVSDGTCDCMQGRELKQGLVHTQSWLRSKEVNQFVGGADQNSSVRFFCVVDDDIPNYKPGVGALELYLSWNCPKKDYRMDRLFSTEEIIEQMTPDGVVQMVPLALVCQAELARQARVRGCVGAIRYFL